MAETLWATSHLAGDCPSPTNANGEWDGVWAGPTTNNSAWTSRWAMDDPSTALAGTQTVTVRVRKTNHSTDPSVAVALYENGTLIRELRSATTVSSTSGVDLDSTFEANEISNPANIEIEVAGSVGSGGPANRASLQLDGIRFVAELDEPGIEIGSTVAGDFTQNVVSPVPAGTEDGHLIVWYVSSNDENAGAFQGVAGPTLVAEIGITASNRLWVYQKRAEDEPASYTFEWADGAQHWHFVVATTWPAEYGEIDSGDIVEHTGTGVTDRTLPSLDADAGDVLLCFGFHWSDTAKSWSSGVRVYQNLSRGIIAGYEEQDSAGSTANHVVTGGTSGNMAAVGMLLRPGAGTIRNLAGSASSTSTTQASAVADLALSGSATSTTATTADLTADMPLDGSASSVSTTTGQLGSVRDLTGSAESASITSGAISRTMVLAGHVASTSSTSARLVAVLAVEGSATSQSTTAAEWILSGLLELTGSVSSASTAGGRLVAELPVSGRATSLTSTAGALFFLDLLSLVGSATSATATDARLVAVVTVDSTATSTSGTSARLVALALVTGSVSSVSTTTGSISFPAAVILLDRVLWLRPITTDLPVLDIVTELTVGTITTDLTFAPVTTPIPGALTNTAVDTVATTALPSLDVRTEVDDEE